MENHRIPSIRFKGFSDAWEQRKLGDIGKTFTGLSGKTANDFGHGEAKFLPYLNIFNNPIADINFLETIEIDSSQNRIQYGDVFFTTSSETPEEVGMSSIWLGNSDNIYLNSFCFGFRPNIELDPYYLGYYLRSNSFRKKITILAQGVSRFNISKNKVLELSIDLPSLKEQKLIGQYFKDLDQSITLHQRKFFNWLLKFELNLIGLFYSWEQRKLSDSVTYRNGKAHESYIAKDGKYIVVNSKFVSTSGDVEKFSNIQIEPLYKGEIAFVLSDVPNGRALARTYLIENNDKYTLNQRIAGLTPNYEMDNYFLHILLNRNSYFLSFDDGAKQTNLSISDVLNFEFKAPGKNEQNKIGNLFKDLDSLITLHQR